MEMTCPHCGYQWTARAEAPKRCPGFNKKTGRICGKWLPVLATK